MSKKVLCIIPNNFDLQTDPGKIFHYKAGVHEMDEEHVNHPYSKANGVRLAAEVAKTETVAETVLPPPVPAQVVRDMNGQVIGDLGAVAPVAAPEVPTEAVVVPEAAAAEVARMEGEGGPAPVDETAAQQ